MQIKLIAYLVAALAVAGMAWKVADWKEKASQLDAAKQELSDTIAKCENDKKITKEVSNGYQNKLAARDARIAELKRLPAKCIVPTAGTTGGRDASTTGAITPGTYAVDSRILIDYAGDMEKYYHQLIACQEFVRRERE